MVVKIRLSRIGAKKKPLYRVVVADEASSRDANIIEVLGRYDPKLDPSLFEVDKDKVLDWIKKGAQPTFSVRKLLGKAGILPPLSFEGKPKRPPRVKEKEEAKAEEEKKPEEVKEGKPEEKKEEKPPEEKKEKPKEEAKAEEAKKPEEVKEKKPEEKKEEKPKEGGG